MARKEVTNYPVGHTHIIKRGKWWHIQYTDLDGNFVRRTLKVTNRTVAEKKAQVISDLIETGDQDALQLQTAPREQRITFSSFLDYFLETFNGWSESTRQGNRYAIEIIRETFGEINLSSITRRQIEGFLRERQSNNTQRASGRNYAFSPATANRYLATLKTIFKMAAEWGYINRSPAIEIRAQKELKKPPKGLHDQEAHALVEAIDHSLVRWLVIFAMDTGLRWSEIESLRWEDVDLRRKTLVAGRKNYEGRMIPLTTQAREALGAMQREDAPGAIWPIKGRQTLVRKRLIAAAERAGLGHISFHHLRHTFATRLLDKGVPLNDVQKLMGHKSPLMTQRYDAPHEDRLHRAIEELQT